MSEREDVYMEKLAEEAIEHLKAIRKYAAWIAFVVVLTFVLAVLGVVLTIVDSNNSSSSDDFCRQYPALC